jgi:hypothetical protein
MNRGRNSDHPPRQRRLLVLRRTLSKIVDHPRTSVALGVLGLAATVATFILSEAGPSTLNRRNVSSAPAVTNPREASQGEPPSPELQPSCDDFRQAATQTRGGQLSIDSPGQIDGGSGNVRARVLPDGAFREILRASIGDEIEVATLLHNSAFTSAEVSSISASISAERRGCWSIVVTPSVPSSPNEQPVLGPALIRLTHVAPSTLEYVDGSTGLFDEKGHALATELADGVTAKGISLPYGVSGGASDFLKFRLRIRARPGATLSPSVQGSPGADPPEARMAIVARGT